MKVGILTYHFSDNYGSVLQAYALQKYICQFCDCEVIDYRKNEVKEVYKIIKPITSRYIFFMDIYNSLYLKKLKKRKTLFENFRNKEIGLSSKTATNKEDLEKFINDYDILICGSDQVWNFGLADFDTSFLFDFDSFDGKRYAYAASMGPKAKSKEDILAFKTLFDKFDCITVRENKTSLILTDILKKDVKTVIDPVFLLDKKDWLELAEKSDIKLPSKYIFCYFPGGVTPIMDKFSLNLANKNNCKRILIESDWHNIFRNADKFYDCSPWDFLRLIRDAEYVCTTSFHGTSFSIILGTPFYVNIGNDSEDDRVTTILNATNNQECLINKDLIEQPDTVTDISEIIKNSKKYINRILENDDDKFRNA